jgi:hypothetical protein
MQMPEFTGKRREDWWVLVILAVLFIYLFVISYISKGLYGDTDSIAHYQLARFAFKYPYHFVHHWGKPLYTTLSAPFAQFGYQGAMTFNILCGILTAWLLYLIARELNTGNEWLVIPFSLFAPVYMVNMMTGLTEILFGLVLVAAIYLFLKDRCIAASVVISFIPYARTEGIMFLVIFLIAFILVKKFRAIPFLLTGFLIFSIAGYPFYKDFFWFFSALPYNEKGSQLYGSGGFWYYLERFPQIMGYPLIFLSGGGMIYMIFRLFHERKPEITRPWLTEYYFLIGSFIAYLFVHSFLWWRGMMGVLGSVRFMVCIMPLGGFLALNGFNFVLSYLGRKRWIKGLLISVTLALILWMPYHIFTIPAPLNWQDKVMKETADAVRKLGHENRRVIFFDPKFGFYLGDDPYDHFRLSFFFPDEKKPDFGLADSSLFIWDAQFAEIHKKLPLESMLRNTNLKLLDGFIPEEDFRFAWRENYMSLIFEKQASLTNQNHWIRIDSMDFENTTHADKLNFLTDTIAYKGEKSMMTGPDCPYSLTITLPLTVFGDNSKVIVRGRVKAFMPDSLNSEKIYLALTVEDRAGKKIRNLTKAASYYKPRSDEWFELAVVSPINTRIPEDGILKVFFWNTTKEVVFVDDLVLEYIPVTDK